MARIMTPEDRALMRDGKPPRRNAVLWGVLVVAVVVSVLLLRVFRHG